MNYLLNLTGEAVRWRQGTNQGVLDPDQQVLLSSLGNMQISRFQGTTTTTLVFSEREGTPDGANTIYDVNPEDLPLMQTALVIRNRVPYRIGVSIDGGPSVISDGERLDLVYQSGVKNLVFSYANSTTSGTIVLPSAPDIGIVIVVPSNRNSLLAGQLLTPGTPITETFFAYTITRDYRLTRETVTADPINWIYVLDSTAPDLGFPQENPPFFWSYNGAYTPPDPTLPFLTASRVLTRPRVDPRDDKEEQPYIRHFWLWAFILIGVTILLGILIVYAIFATSSGEEEESPMVVAYDNPYGL